jgi:hypothetical protein
MLSIHPHDDIHKKEKNNKKIVGENLSEASRIELRMKTSNGGSLRSEE